MHWHPPVAGREGFPKRNAQERFFTQPATLVLGLSSVHQRVICPEAVTPYKGVVSDCPPVPLAKILIAALWSRQSIVPQLHWWVLVLKDFLILLPQLLQSWLVNLGSTAIISLLNIAPKYSSHSRKIDQLASDIDKASLWFFTSPRTLRFSSTITSLDVQRVLAVFTAKSFLCLETLRCFLPNRLIMTNL